jgi:hypothetical protein
MQSLFQHFSGRVFRFGLCLFVFILFSSMLYAQNCQSNNFAANHAVTASDGADIAANVVDGNLTTDWYGAADSKSIYVDLDSSKSLCKVTLKMGLWATITQTVIQGSNNASTWTDLYTISAGTQTNHVSNGDYSYDYLDIDLSSITTSYRYVKLYYPSGMSWGPHLKELEVYIKQAAATPTVSITRPTNGNTYLQGSTINIAANALEEGGSIGKVEYYANNTLLGQSLTAPYTFNWTNVQAGDYTLTARAYDASNQVSVSSTAAIHVNIPGWSLTGNGSTNTSNFLGTTDTTPLIFKTNGVERLRVNADGKIGIKTSVIPNDADVAIGGNISVRKLKVTQDTWADFVFDKNHKIPTLEQLEKYIDQNNHLPGVPTTTSVQKNGLDVGDNQTLLLQKIEELTLYVIQLNKEIEKLKKLKEPTLGKGQKK